MKPVKKLTRRIILLVIIVVLAAGALSYVGCVSCAGGEPDGTMELDGMTMNYPAEWGEAENLSGTSLMGITIPQAVGIQNSMTTMAALADVSSLGMTPERLEGLLSDYDVTFESTMLDGRDAVRVDGSALFVHVRAVGVVEDGRLTDVAIVTCNSVEEKSNAALFEAIIDSVQVR